MPMERGSALSNVNPLGRNLRPAAAYPRRIAPRFGTRTRECCYGRRLYVMWRSWMRNGATFLPPIRKCCASQLLWCVRQNPRGKILLRQQVSSATAPIGSVTISCDRQVVAPGSAYIVRWIDAQRLFTSYSGGGAVPHGRRSCPAERQDAGASDVLPLAVSGEVVDGCCRAFVRQRTN
jgi:hypothetical protein